MRNDTYKIIDGYSKVEISKQVNDAIDNEGWEPLGGVSITCIPGPLNSFYYCQAMVK